MSGHSMYFSGVFPLLANVSSEFVRNADEGEGNFIIGPRQNVDAVVIRGN
jgi:hypothetical protein